MTPQEALEFVATSGVVLESAKGPVPNLAEAVAGEPMRGSYWSHPRSHEILACARAVRGSADILVCRLVRGKVTFVHRRLWPALVRLAARFPAGALDAIEEIHTPSGKHEVRTTPFPDWVSDDVSRAARQLPEEEAVAILSPYLDLPAPDRLPR
jgi:hypothetical protein